jgi:hypothetical protein
VLAAGERAFGLWLVFAPLIFWAPSAAAYMNDKAGAWVETDVLGEDPLSECYDRQALEPARRMCGL